MVTTGLLAKYGVGSCASESRGYAVDNATDYAVNAYWRCCLFYPVRKAFFWTLVTYIDGWDKMDKFIGLHDIPADFVSLGSFEGHGLSQESRDEVDV
jgi:hypothetical protein